MYAWIEYLQYVLQPEKLIQKLDILGKKILFISGDEDHCFIDGARSVVKKAKNMEMKVIEKCGHICSIENWKTFNQLALDYLKFHGERKETKITN